MSVRLYYDLVAFQALIAETSVLNIDSFKVYESSSKDGNFVNVASFDYNPRVDFITVPAFVAAVGTVATIDGYSSEFDWFKLSYLAGYQALASIVAEVVDVSGVVFSQTLATYPVQAGSVVLKLAGVTLGTTVTLNPMGDLGDGTITGDQIIAATVDYTTGLLAGTLATIDLGALTADYRHFTEYQVESDLSDPVLAENIATIIEQVRVAIKDTSEDAPAFTDDELILKVREAIKRFTGENSSVITHEYQLSVIILLVRISCAYDLAYNTARYYHLELPDNLRLFRGEITEHYLNVAKALEGQYKRLTEDLGEGGSRAFEVVDCTKKSYFKSSRFRSQGYTDAEFLADTITLSED